MPRMEINVVSLPSSLPPPKFINFLKELSFRIEL